MRAFTLLVFTLFACAGFAQDNNPPAATPDSGNDNNNRPPENPPPQNRPSETRPPENRPSATSAPQGDPAGDEDLPDAADLTRTSAKTSATRRRITSTLRPTASSSDDAPLPTDLGVDDDLPSIEELGGFRVPTVTPPPIKNAPFMQKSTLPEGFVFIVVGAGLGFCAMVVVLWRMLVAWSLHRSVRRAALASSGGYTDVKTTLLRNKEAGGDVGPGGFYAAGPGSSVSLDHLASAGRSPAAKPTPNSSLFFSPTSNAAAMAASDNRRSSYLPSGFYAAGNRNSSIPPSNSSQTHFRDMSVGSSRLRGVSPPGSPMMRSRDGSGNIASTERLSGMRVNDSQTSLAQQQGRAPSAYLEDLFENHRQGSSAGGSGHLGRF